MISDRLNVGVPSLSLWEKRAAEDFKKLSDAQIRRTFAGMEFTDQVHWAERYGADGRLTTREMGTTRLGAWRVEGDQLCVDLGKEGGRGCYEVWISGNKVGAE